VWLKRRGRPLIVITPRTVSRSKHSAVGPNNNYRRCERWPTRHIPRFQRTKQKINKLNTLEVHITHMYIYTSQAFIRVQRKHIIKHRIGRVIN